jgi:hypothetical protein
MDENEREKPGMWLKFDFVVKNNIEQRFFLTRGTQKIKNKKLKVRSESIFFYI